MTTVYRPAATRRILCVGALLAALPGCVVLPPQRFDMSSDVLFDFGRASLKPSASDALRDTLAQILAAFPSPRIKVEGHTDSIGSEAANDALSVRRAEAVRVWLVNTGVPDAMIQVQGMGSRMPVAPNTTPSGRDDPAGRARNRRVTLVAAGA